MFQGQDVLYRNGSLSVVWMVGNGAVKNIIGNSKIGRTIRSANISELCDRLMQVASIPDRLPAVGDGHDESHENFMDIRKLAILLYGLYEIYKHQLKAFKKRLDVHYDKIKWRAPESFDLDPTSIDLPRGRKQPRPRDLVMETPTRSIVPENFGHLSDDPVIIAGVTPRAANLGQAPISEDFPYEQFDMENFDIMSALNAATVNRNKRKRRRSPGPSATGDIGNDELLDWLQQSRSSKDRHNITIQEEDFVNSPRLIARQHENEFTFEDYDNRDSVGFSMNPTFNDPGQLAAGHADVDMEIAEGHQGEVVVEAMEPVASQGDGGVDQIPQGPEITTPVRPVVPVNAARLAQRIQIDNLNSPQSEVVPRAPRRKRARVVLNQRLIVDEAVKIPANDFRSQVKQSRMDDAQVFAMGNRGTASVPEANVVFPSKLRPGKNAVLAIQNHVGRGMGLALSKYVDKIRKSIAEIKVRGIEQRRRAGSEITEGQPTIGTSRDAIAQEGSVSQEGLGPRPSEGRSVGGMALSTAEEGAFPSGIRTTGIVNEGVSIPDREADRANVEAENRGYSDANLPMVDADLQEIVMLGQEMASPNRPGFENDVEPMLADEIDIQPLADAGIAAPVSGEPHVAAKVGNLRTFRERCPPETTRRGDAASEFFRLLKLQKKKKILLLQDTFCGPISIQPLP